MVDGSKSGVVEAWEIHPRSSGERVEIGRLGAVNKIVECGNGYGAPLYSHGVETSR